MVSDNEDLYENDFSAWCKLQANLLKEKQIDRIDTQRIRQELEDLGKSQERALKSYLHLLQMHTVKLKIRPDYPHKESWITTINNCKIHIKEILEENRSLNCRTNIKEILEVKRRSLVRELQEFLHKALEKGKRSVSKETKLPWLEDIDIIKFELEEVLDKSIDDLLASFAEEEEKNA